MTGNESKKPKASGRGGFQPNSGRPKGSLDKGNAAAARNDPWRPARSRGGQQYLEGVAQWHPQAFVSLLGKVLPTTLDGQISHTINWPVGSAD